jgi:hypothetical protein
MDECADRCRFVGQDLGQDARAVRKGAEMKSVSYTTTTAAGEPLAITVVSGDDILSVCDNQGYTWTRDESEDDEIRPKTWFLFGFYAGVFVSGVFFSIWKYVHG